MTSAAPLIPEDRPPPLEDHYVWHVYPMSGKPHVTVNSNQGCNCWCMPTVEYQAKNGKIVSALVIHNREQ